MQVLDDHDERTVGAEPLQQAGGEFEEPDPAVLAVRLAAAGAAVAQFGQQPGQFGLLAGGGAGQLGAQGAVQVAQRGGDRCERQSVRTDLHTAAHGGDGPGRAGRPEELLGEAGLPDARLAPDQHRLGLAAVRRGERGGQAGQLGVAADEHGAEGLGLHAAEHRTPGPRRDSG